MYRQKIIKQIVYFEVALRNQYYRLKGKLLKIYLLFHGCKVGKKVKCKKWPIFRFPPNRNLVVGDFVTFGYNITFDVTNKGRIVIEDSANLTQDILISSDSEVRIGQYALIGESVSIRDANHETNANLFIAKQPLDSKSILIEKDVWIGAGSRILKGSLIKKGCIIGANSVVTQGSITEDYNIYAGSPIKHIRRRK